MGSQQSVFSVHLPCFLDGTFSFDFVRSLSGVMPTNRLKDQENIYTDHMKFRCGFRIVISFEACNHVFELGHMSEQCFLTLVL